MSLFETDLAASFSTLPRKGGFPIEADYAMMEDRLRRYLAARFSSIADVDDIIQQAYLRLLRARMRCRIRSARDFLFIAARNIALDVIRRRKTSPVVPTDFDQVCAYIADHRGVREAVERAELRRLLSDAIAALPPRRRAILRLHRLQEVPQKEIAARFGLSRHTVENHVADGVRGCALYLRKRGIHRQS